MYSEETINLPYGLTPAEVARRVIVWHEAQTPPPVLADKDAVLAAIEAPGVTKMQLTRVLTRVFDCRMVRQDTTGAWRYTLGPAGWMRSRLKERGLSAPWL